MKAYEKLAILGLTWGLAGEAQALVDYSIPENIRPQSSGAAVVSPRPKPPQTPRPKVKIRPRTTSSKTVSKAQTMEKRFNMGAGLETVGVDLQGLQGPEVRFMRLKAQGQIAGQFFFEGRYWQAQSSSPVLAPKGRWQAGNPLLLVGFHWLQLGPLQGQVNLDLYGGFQWKAKKSHLASGRTDRILGLSTAKRFSKMALGLGYEMHLTGTSAHEDEMRVGNLSKASASLGLQLGPGSRLLVEAFRYSINPETGISIPAPSLKRKLRFSVLSPKLQLNLFSLHPSLKMELGATFRSQRLRDRNLIAARLWNLQGSYGNSLYGGLSLSL